MWEDKTQDKYIDIAMCFDENIARQVCVVIKSIMCNKEKDDSIYRIHCITNAKAHMLIVEYLEDLLGIYRNHLCVEFYILKNNPFEGAYEIRNITTASYYRFLLAEFLLDIDKVLYLDVDVLVLGDLKELFQKELNELYLCGVKTEINLKRNWQQARKEFMPEKFEVCRGQYINAGVLLMNLKEIRKSDIVSRWKEMSQVKFHYQDQDIINLTCFSKIGFLPLKYNMFLGQSIVNKEQLIEERVYSKSEIEDATRTPVIVHFAGSKPWNSFVHNSNDMAKEWWKYVLDDSVLFSWFKDDIVKCMSNDQNAYQHMYCNMYLRKLYESQVFRRLLQLSGDNSNFVKKLKQMGFEKIAIYGIGPVGEYIIRVLKDSEIHVCYGIDREKMTSESGLRVYKPNDALPDIDAIINTVSYSHKEIKTQLEKVECPIVVIDELMDVNNVLLEY